MDPVPIRIKRLLPHAVLPEYQTAHAAFGVPRPVVRIRRSAFGAPPSVVRTRRAIRVRWLAYGTARPGRARGAVERLGPIPV